MGALVELKTILMKNKDAEWIIAAHRVCKR